MLTPEQLAKSNTEDAHQIAVIQWAALNTHRWPCLKWLHAIPNSGVFGNDKQTRIIRASKMKAMGMRPGVFDMFLPQPCGHWHGLYIEMKRPSTDKQKAGTLSTEQKEFGDFVWYNGYYCVLCYGWLEATTIIESYLKGELQ